MITQKWMKPIGATFVALIMALAVVMALPVTRAVAEQTVTWSDPETVDFENYAVGALGRQGAGMPTITAVPSRLPILPAKSFRAVNRLKSSKAAQVRTARHITQISCRKAKRPK